VRAKNAFNWSIPTYQLFIDVRASTLDQLLDLRAKLLKLPGTNAHFTLLAPWKVLAKRYSPLDDPHGDLREIHNSLNGDLEYSFKDIGSDSQLTIEELIEGFTHGPTPYYIYAEANGEFDLKDLIDYLLASQNGLVGIVNKKDQRAFAVFAPALARALTANTPLYKSIERQWGVLWMNDDQFAVVNQGKHNRLKRFFRYLKREGKKINSPRQFFVFVQKVISLLLRKVLGRG
jgi:hypothetical protein